MLGGNALRTLLHATLKFCSAPLTFFPSFTEIRRTTPHQILPILQRIPKWGRPPGLRGTSTSRCPHKREKLMLVAALLFCGQTVCVCAGPIRSGCSSTTNQPTWTSAAVLEDRPRCFALLWFNAFRVYYSEDTENVRLDVARQARDRDS